MMNTDTLITELKGIGPKNAGFFAAAGIYTAGDIMSYYPRGYDSYKPPVSITALQEGYIDAVCGAFFTKLSVLRKGRRSVTTGIFRDGSGELEAVWFNMPYLRSSIQTGIRIILRAKVKRKGKQFQMVQPEIIPADAYGSRLASLQPVYSLPGGISNNLFIRTVRQCIDSNISFEEFLPHRITERYGLLSHDSAICGIHFPESPEVLAEARKRLAFEEFFLFILSVRISQHGNARPKNAFLFQQDKSVSKLLESLPFTMTNAQNRVWQEIRSDMSGKSAMARLIQGDVGSGKTILALLALVYAAENGYQGALMAPTEVLANQHYNVIIGFLKRAGLAIHTVLLTGQVTGAARREILEELQNGSASIIIGTHALIQDPVVFRDLALVITDEQHRFGVRQRQRLSGKGSSPHVLVMSATPIPRTLAMMLYGNLDLSAVDEKPAERLPVKTCFVGTDYREKAYRFIDKEIGKGHQAYIICPLVSASESLDGEDVATYAERIKSYFHKNVCIEYLHGKMKQEEKNRIMNLFAENKIQILVSTTVVEVGVDVPNASVMMIENAERFGLSALHQLRGRVGRSSFQSYCILVSGRITPELQQRMDILCTSDDGFYIAEEDLKLRGPGELFGVRQSGLIEFRAGDIYENADILENAVREAECLLNDNPQLDGDEYKPLQQELLKIHDNSEECDI